MDVNTVVGLDAVDGLNLRASTVCHLVVGTARNDGSFDVGALERSTRDGDDGAASARCLAHRIGFVERHFQLHHKLQLRSFWSYLIVGLGAGSQRHDGHNDQEKDFLHSDK